MLKDRNTNLWSRIQLRRGILLRAGVTSDQVDDHIEAWLPRHYPNGLGFPRLDYRYVRAINKAVIGGVFLDAGSLHNAHNDRRRLMKDWTQEGIDGNN